MITLIGAVFLLGTLWAAFFRRRSLIWILSLSLPFVATAAVTVGANSIPPFYVVAPALLVVASLESVSTRSRRHPVKIILVLFTIWSLGVTLFSPRFFSGTEVLIPRGGIDQQIAAPGLLEYTASNLAQALYLILGVGVVFYIARLDRVSPHILTPGLSLGSLLSSGKVIAGDSWPGWIFDTYAGLSYSQDRFRGIFPEPSYLAVFSIAALTYFFLMLLRTKGRRSLAYLVLVFSSSSNLVLSQSGTAAISIAVVVAIASAVWLAGFIFGTRKAEPVRVVLVFFVMAGFVLAGEQLATRYSGLIMDKRESLSFANRTAADVFSMKIMTDTLGFGAGLGSSRPSSMLAMLLSCVGIVGAGLFLVALMSAIKNAAKNRPWLPMVWSFFALIVAKSIAEPALSTPLIWFMLGLSVYASMERLTPEKGGPQSGETVLASSSRLLNRP